MKLHVQLLKFCSLVFNFVFLVLGLSVAACAVWILFDRGNLLTLLSSEDLRTVGAGLLLIGGVVLLVSIMGCVGVNGENRFLLLVYLVFLIVLVLGQLFVTVLLLFSRNKIEGSLDLKVDQMVLQYGGDGPREDRLMDNIQNFGACCGRTGPSDWLQNAQIQNLTDPGVLPCSCFTSYRHGLNVLWCSEQLNVSDPLIGRGNNSYDQGCKKQLSDWLQGNMVAIVGMDVGLVLIQVVQFALAVYLYRMFGRKAALKRTHPLDDSDHAHLDHAPEDDVDHAALNDGHIDPAHPEYYHDNQSHN